MRLGWTHICVDGFQDMNRVQYDLVRLIAPQCWTGGVRAPTEAQFRLSGPSPSGRGAQASLFPARLGRAAQNLPRVGPFAGGGDRASFGRGGHIGTTGGFQQDFQEILNATGLAAVPPLPGTRQTHAPKRQRQIRSAPCGGVLLDLRSEYSVCRILR